MIVLFACVALMCVVSLLYNFRLGVYVFVFLYSIYPRVLSIGIGSQGNALTLQRAVIALYFLMFFAIVIFKKQLFFNFLQNIKRNFMLLAVMVAVLAFRFVSGMLGGEDKGIVLVVVANDFLFGVFSTLLIAMAIESKRDIYGLVLVFCSSLFINEFAGVLEHFKGSPLFQGLITISYDTGTSKDVLAGRMRGDVYRITGLFVNPLELSGFVCIMLPFAFYLWLYGMKMLHRLLGFVCAFLAVPVAIWTDSRAAVMVVIFVFCGALYWLIRRGLRAYARMAVYMSFIAVVFIVAVVGFDVFVEKVLMGGDTATASSESRLKQHVEGIPMILSNPIIGAGLARNVEQIVDLSQVDSYYLKIGFEGGMLCLVFFLISIRLVWLRLRSCYRFADTNQERRLIVAFMGSLLTVSVTMAVVSIPFNYFYFYVIAGVAAKLNQYRLNNRVATYRMSTS